MRIFSSLEKAIIFIETLSKDSNVSIVVPQGEKKRVNEITGVKEIYEYNGSSADLLKI